jgi:IS30 family transposase
MDARLDALNGRPLTAEIMTRIDLAKSRIYPGHYRLSSIIKKKHPSSGLQSIMPLDSRHRRIIKHSKRQQTVLLNAIIPVVAQYTMSTALSFLFNRPPTKPMRKSDRIVTNKAVTSAQAKLADKMRK